MSEQQPGPGWWLASDGRWYPPELAPGDRPPDNATATAAAGAETGAPESTPAPPDVGEPRPSPTAPNLSRPAPVAVATPPEPPPRIGRLLAVVAGLIVLGGAAAAAGYLLTDDSDGPTTATTETTDTPTSEPTDTSNPQTTSTLPPNVAVVSDARTGVSVGAPDGWIGIVLTGRTVEEVQGEITASLDPSFAGLMAVLRQAEASLTRGDAVLLANVSAPEAVGTLAVVTTLSLQDDPRDPAVEASLRTQLEGINAIDIESGEIELPAGPALRFDYHAPVQVGDRTVDIVGRKYVIQANRANWMLTMNTDDPARDGSAFDTMADTFLVE